MEETKWASIVATDVSSHPIVLTLTWVHFVVVISFFY